MKTFQVGLQNAIQTTYSNNGVTTLLGRVFQKTLQGQQALGPSRTQFIDVQTLAGFSPLMSFYNPTTQHLFVVSGASANPSIALFNFNSSNGTYSYVGKVIMSLANSAVTTYTFRGFKVYESGGVINLLLSTGGSVATNGGTYAALGLSTADFTVGSTTIYSASGPSQKAVYFLQDPANVGVAHVATTAWGVALPYSSSNSALNTKVYQLNGTIALPQVFSWDLAGTPSVDGTVTNGVSAKTTTYAGTSPAAFYQMASQNGYNVTNGDAVVLMNGTGNVPTNTTPWAPGTSQTAANVYFVRDLQNVSGAWQFNLSTTLGGAAVTPTSTTSNFTMMRAFGISSSLFNIKTGILPAFTLGTLLTNNSSGYCKPVNAPASSALNGQDCIYFMTTTALYIGKITDLTSLGTTWASMTFSGINITGTGVDITTPAVANGTYSGQGNASDIDQFIYSVTGSIFVLKPYQPSNITSVFGGSNNQYFETLNPITVPPGAVTITDVSCYGGWMFISSGATGQRGIIFTDLFSAGSFGNSAIISAVQSVPSGTTLKYINNTAAIFSLTNEPAFWIRSAATSTDASFNSATLPVGVPITSGVVSNGWTSIVKGSDLSGMGIGPYFQLCVTFPLTSQGIGVPAQIIDAQYSCYPPGEQSDNWSVDQDQTTQGTGSPNYTAWYMTQVYASVVPTLYARVIDTNGNLIFSANTSANPTAFQYSTNNGTSWTSLGTIPNTVGTLVRVLVTPTPSVLASPSLRES